MSIVQLFTIIARLKEDVESHHLKVLISTKVTIQVSFLLRRLRRRSGREGRGHPAPRQRALQAPWKPLLNSYNIYNKYNTSNTYIVCSVYIERWERGERSLEGALHNDMRHLYRGLYLGHMSNTWQ
jgi:hypothetical protein